jgi:hypothetical protein
VTAHNFICYRPFDRRFEEYRQDPDRVVTWEEAKARILSGRRFREVPPEACGVCQNVAGVLFEGDEDAQLAELARPVDQCLQGDSFRRAAASPPTS